MSQCALTFSTEQTCQEEQYSFPYHHLPEFNQDRFSEVRALTWGHEYMSYVRYVLDQLEHLNPASVVEIGCGDGRVILEASRRLPACRLVGVDYSLRAVAMARALHPGGEYRAGDITEAGFWRERFSTALAVEVLEHIPPLQLPLFVKSIATALEPDGHLLVTVPSVNTPINAKHYQHFSPATLQYALAPHFDIMECHWLNADLLWAKLISLMLCNRLFALRSKQVTTRLYRLYESMCLRASKANGKRLFALAGKSK
jgi:SAM-dependent methyltransferase